MTRYGLAERVQLREATPERRPAAIAATGAVGGGMLCGMKWVSENGEKRWGRRRMLGCKTRWGSDEGGPGTASAVDGRGARVDGWCALKGGGRTSPSPSLVRRGAIVSNRRDHIAVGLEQALV
jgi:hypothetical protein